MVLSLCLIAAALSADGLAAGISLGMRGVKIPWCAKLLIAVVSGGFAAASILMGKQIAAYLPEQVQRLIGGGLLIGLGALAAFRAVLPAKKPNEAHEKKPKMIRLLGYTILVMRNPANGDLDTSGKIDLGEALLLGISLSVDMLGAGMGLVISGGFAAVKWLPLLVGLAQTASLSCGAHLGKWVSIRMGQNSKIGVASGLLLAAMGVIRIFT